jgi:hypothetical protein
MAANESLTLAELLLLVTTSAKAVVFVTEGATADIEATGGMVRLAK